MLTISVHDIKRFYPNDIGAISIFKNITVGHKLIPVKKTDNNSNRYSRSISTTRKIHHYSLDKLEAIIEKQKNGMHGVDQNSSRDRLEEVIKRIREENQSVNVS